MVGMSSSDTPLSTLDDVMECFHSQEETELQNEKDLQAASATQLRLSIYLGIATVVSGLSLALTGSKWLSPHEVSILLFARFGITTFLGAWTRQAYRRSCELTEKVEVYKRKRRETQDNCLIAALMVGDGQAAPEVLDRLSLHTDVTKGPDVYKEEINQTHFGRSAGSNLRRPEHLRSDEDSTAKPPLKRFPASNTGSLSLHD